MNLLTFSTLYPNAGQPVHGIHVATRVAGVVATGGASTRVIAPIPFVPDAGFIPKRYRAFAEAPHREERGGISVFHPRYLVIPKVGMSLAPLLLYLGAMRCAASLIKNGHSIDLIDAHYFYPDGVAAVMLGRRLRKPVVITAHGTDLNLIPEFRVPRALIRWAAGEAAGIVTVCAALRKVLLDMGVDGGKIRVLPNAADLELFHPLDRAAARARLGFTGPTLVSVGLLIPRKGHDLVIGALPMLPGMALVIAGDGPQREQLASLARELHVADRVRFLGNLPQSALAEIYASADALVLASSREGWACVLIEAMACGTPVVASNIWGNPEVVASPDVGELMDERTPAGVAQAVKRLLDRQPDRAKVRLYAERFTWADVSARHVAFLAEVLRSSP